VRALLTGLAKSLITTVIVFVLAEAGLRAAYAARNAMVRRVPLPYSVGDDYGPTPPWLDRMLILVPDERLIWRNLPNVRRTYVDIFSPAPTEASRTALLRRFLPTIPAEFDASPTWTIALNSQGFRSDEFAAERRGALRVACVGDSWTFGMNVDQDRTYPSQLSAALRARDAHAEVENFGVLGYSSFQGLELPKSRVLDQRPDVVAIGFGMNDSEVAGYRDRDMIATGPPSVRTRALETAKDLEFYKLLNYLALLLRFHPKSIADYVREQAKDRGSGAVDYSTIEPWTRVSPHDFAANLGEMIALSRAQGAAVVLLDNELWAESPYRAELRTIAADAHVPLIDSLQIVADARGRIERDIESRLGLGRATEEETTASSQPAAPTTVVFRVSRGRYAVPRAIAIAGTDRQLGDVVPNTVWMHDDGRDGDERAGDGVWSFAATFASGNRVSYVYTNSGTAGRWEGLDVPHIRSVTIPASADGAPVYLPIETFGEVYMQADDWHTNAVGYDLIARAVADVIRSLKPQAASPQAASRKPQASASSLSSLRSLRLPPSRTLRRTAIALATAVSRTVILPIALLAVAGFASRNRVRNRRRGWR
jgi:lysophospholipase L1-like esterase